MGRKKKYSQKILSIISNSVNGIRVKDIKPKVSCCEATLHNYLKHFKEDGIIIKSIDNRYYLKEKESEINLIPKHIIGFRDYMCLFTLNALVNLSKEEKINLSNLVETIKFFEKNSEIFGLMNFDTALIDSIEIKYQGKKPFYISDFTQSRFIKKIQLLIYDFITVPEIFLNISSFSDFSFKFTITFGKDLEERFSRDLNFSELKDTLSKTLKIKDNPYISQLKDLGKFHYIQRNEREYYIKEQISRIKEKLYSYEFLEDKKIDFFNTFKEYYRNFLNKWSMFDKDNIHNLRRNLNSLTQVFLKYIESTFVRYSSQGLDKIYFSQELDKIYSEIDNLIKRFNENVENSLIQKIGDIKEKAIKEKRIDGALKEIFKIGLRLK